MNFQGITQDIESVITPLVEYEGLNLWDIALVAEGGRPILRITIENPGRPVSVDDCIRVSRAVEDIIEVKGFLPKSYSLEVSSPGIYRSLKKKEHFQKYIGHSIQLTTKDLVGGRRNFKGELTSAGGDQIIVHGEEGDSPIAYFNILKAQLT